MFPIRPMDKTTKLEIECSTKSMINKLCFKKTLTIIRHIIEKKCITEDKRVNSEHYLSNSPCLSKVLPDNRYV